MLKGSESSSAWSILKRELDRRNWIYDRIENRVVLGMPDVNVHVPQVGDLWVELKFVRVPLGKRVNVGLSKEQFNWLCQNTQAGRRAVLVARIGMHWYKWDTPAGWRLAKQSSLTAEVLGLATEYRQTLELVDSWR